MLAKKIYIDNNGRISIPAKLRAKFNIKPGDELSVSYTDEGILLSTYQYHLQKARNILSKYEDKDLLADLKQMRVEDAQKD